jgi:hypothetical protein
MEEFRLMPPDHNYYVYALIDPRDNEMFYVGKGKENRYKHHLKTTLKANKTKKHHRIDEINDDGYKVKIVKLIDYLSEVDAFKIEEIIIYNIGRKIFKEGSLLNLIRGGNIGRESNLLYYEKLDTSVLQNNLIHFNKKFLNCAVKSSNIKFLSEISIKLIYEYDFEGNFIKEFSIEEFLSDQLYCYSFNLLIERNCPLMFYNRIFSSEKLFNFHKYKYDNPINYFLPYDKKFIKKLEDGLDSAAKFNFNYKFYEGFKVSVKNEDYTIIEIFENDKKLHEEAIFGSKFVHTKNRKKYKEPLEANSYPTQNSTLTDEEKKERNKASAGGVKFNGRLQ